MSESKKIQGSDLIAPGYLKDAIAEAEKFLQVIASTKKVIIDTNKATAQKLKDSKGSDSKALKEQNALMAESVKQRKLAVAAEQIEIKATLDLQKAKKALADFEKKKLIDDEKVRKAMEDQAGAYKAASARLNKLRNEYKDLAISGRGAEQATKDLLKSIQDLDKELKKTDADVGQFNREVGNYKTAVKEAISETTVFKEGMDKLGDSSNIAIAGFGSLVAQYNNLKKATKETENGVKKLSLTLKAVGIAVVIAALTSLYSFFTANREGVLEFDLAMNKLKATLDILVGSVAKVGKSILLHFKAIGFYLKGLKEDLKNPFSESIEAQKAYAEQAKLSKQASELMSKAFEGNYNAIAEQIKGYDELTKAIFKFEDELRVLSVKQEQIKMDEEDYNEIFQDTTISLNEQKHALERAIEARLAAAKIGSTIAEKEFELSKKELELKLRRSKVSEADIALAKKAGFENLTAGKLSIKVSTDELNKINETYLARLHAADVLEDLDRQEAERKRQLVQTETIAQIELIRSKKLGADAQVQILTKQVADEKEQLEDREKFQQELTNRQLAAQGEEIKLLENFGLTQNEILDLINEKDAVLLANKLKNLRATRLSEAQETELAKVILESQNAQIARDEQIAKFEEEKIKRQQKILRLEQEIAIINESSVLDEVTNIEQQRQEILNKSNAQILVGENVFNKKLLDQRKNAIYEEQAIMEEKFKIQQDLLYKQHEIDRANIEQTVNDNQVKEKELEKLDATYYHNKNKLDSDQHKQVDLLKQKTLEDDRVIANKQTEIIVTQLQQATQALTNELDRRQAIQNSKAEYQIHKTETLIQRQEDLAARGLANTLAYQQSQLDKQNLAQLDAQKRQAKQKEELQLADALFNAYNAELQQKDNTGKLVNTPATAAFKALSDVLLLKGIAAGLVQFAADGNDDVQGQGTTTSDSIPFMLSKHEGVVKAEANMGNPGVVSALNAGIFDQLYMPKYDMETLSNSGNTAQNISNSLLIHKNEEIVSLLKEIKNKPVQQVDVDKLGNLIETTYKNGIKTVTKYKNRRSIG